MKLASSLELEQAIPRLPREVEPLWYFADRGEPFSRQRLDDAVRFAFGA